MLSGWLIGCIIGVICGAVQNIPAVEILIVVVASFINIAGFMFTTGALLNKCKTDSYMRLICAVDVDLLMLMSFLITMCLAGFGTGQDEVSMEKEQKGKPQEDADPDKLPSEEKKEQAK